MHHKSVARTFLNWFYQEAEQFGTLGTVLYASGTDFVERYTNCQTGCVVNAMDFVSAVADARLGHADADKVREAAAKLLRP